MGNYKTVLQTRHSGNHSKTETIATVKFQDLDSPSEKMVKHCQAFHYLITFMQINLKALLWVDLPTDRN